MRRFTGRSAVLLALGLLACRTAEEVRPSAPPAAGLEVSHLEWIAEAVQAALDQGRMPGCVVAVGRSRGPIYLRAFGHRSLQPERRPMAVDTVFDLASLTKPIATACSAMLLVERGQVRLGDPVARHLPEFGANGKEAVTLRQLLVHCGGLIPDNALADYEDGPERAWQRIFELSLRSPPGERFSYTDVGFLVLGKLVERVSGMSLAEFTRRNLFEPLAMGDTGFLPREELRQRAAPTETRAGRWMQGEVHDPRAYPLGGVAGHAGLFSTAPDLVRFARMLLGGGQLQGVRVLSERTVATMTEPVEVDGQLRALGWDVRSRYSSNRGELLSEAAFGHGGFTGTALWIDPQLDLFAVFLSNRVHPDGKGRVNDLAGRIGSIAAAAVRRQDRKPMPGTEPAPGPPATRAGGLSVKSGLEVLCRDGFRPLAGKRVGLITNHTGRDSEGVRTADLLADEASVELVALFSPEHGLSGDRDGTVGNARDPGTELPVFSLYGDERRPRAEQLQGLDALVFDIQDAGTRFYTYISTLGLAMEAAADAGIAFVVLDRPNPLGGLAQEGPLLDAGREDFTGWHRLPVRHGMTVGELALLFRAERGMDLDLVVVTMESWRRDYLFEDTGLPWVNPSPNLRRPTQALLYPGIGLLEFTNLSVGRGTDTPFEVIGAPWLDGVALARRLGGAGIAGAAFAPIRFTPESSVHEGVECGGVCISVTSREQLQPVRLGLEIACALRDLYPQQWTLERFDRLLRHAETLEGLRAGYDAGALQSAWRNELREFALRREPHLLYP